MSIDDTKLELAALTDTIGSRSLNVEGSPLLFRARGARRSQVRAACRRWELLSRGPGLPAAEVFAKGGGWSR